SQEFRIPCKNGYAPYLCPAARRSGVDLSPASFARPWLLAGSRPEDVAEQVGRAGRALQVRVLLPVGVVERRGLEKVSVLQERGPLAALACRRHGLAHPLG